MPIASAQTEAIRALIGEKAQNLRGELVHAFPIAALDNTAEKKISLIIGEQIPSDVNYSVIDEHKMLAIKRSLTVRINKPVTRKVLEVIARRLKATDSVHYQRTFIVYLLPGMPQGDLAWATSHFDPELKVEFIGISGEQLDAMPNESVLDGCRLVGEWVREAGSAYRIRILERDGATTMRTTYTDGSSGDEELSAAIVSQLVPFATKTAAIGDYWVIDAQGNLDACDAAGIYATYVRTTR